MIETVTTRTIRLPDSTRSRLLLKFSGFHAFTEDQLKLVVSWAVKDMHSFIDANCLPAAGAPYTYFRPGMAPALGGGKVDPEVQKAFDEAFEFLCYVGLAGNAGPNTIWIRSEPRL